MFNGLKLNYSRSVFSLVKKSSNNVELEDVQNAQKLACISAV